MVVLGGIGAETFTPEELIVEVVVMGAKNVNGDPLLVFVSVGFGARELVGVLAEAVVEAGFIEEQLITDPKVNG